MQAEESPVAELVRRFRRAGAMSQAALAQACGLSERTIRDLERGVTARPRAWTLRAVADALGLQPEDRRALLAAARQPPTEVAAPLPSAWPGRGGLVGRQAELAALLGLIRKQVRRLITVTGTGGVGKSRLAAEAATLLAGESGAAVHVVDVSGVVDAAMVGEIVAEAVGAGGRSRLDAVTRVAAELRERRVVLFLDGFERVVAAAPGVRELVGRCPGLSVVVTSRVPLRVGAEWLVRLEPLPVPAVGADVAALGEVPAMALLVRQAGRAWPGFELTAANAEELAAICRAVEGLPLGLELAAARLRTLSPAELAGRLGRRLELLSDGPRDLPDRQRSLRATIGHSLDLVGESSRRLFARLAPFAAGARLSDLEAVVTALDGDCGSLIDALSGLVDASLLRPRREQGNTRYVLPDAAREFASESLGAEREAVFAAFAAHYLGRVRTDAYADLDADAGNVRAALTAATTADVATVEALFGWYEQRGRFVEGRAALTALSGGTGDGAAWAALRAGRLAQYLGDSAGADRLAEHGAARLRPDDAAGHAIAGLLLGTLAVERGDLDAGIRHTRAAVDAARAAGDERTLARALHNVAGTLWYIGDFAVARELMADALAAKRRAGADDADLGRTLMNLAELAYGADAFGAAVTLATQAIELLQRGGHDRYRALAHTLLALATLQTDPLAALATMHEAVRLTDSFGEDTGLRGLVLCRSSLVLAATGRYAEAADTLAAGAGALPGVMAQDDLPMVIEQHAARLAGRHADRAAMLLGIAGRLRAAGARPAEPLSARITGEVRERCAAVLGADGLAVRLEEGAAVAAERVPAAIAAAVRETGAPDTRGPRDVRSGTVSRTTSGRTTRPSQRQPLYRTAR
jgi:predicted ATPase/DNA-binding XRE family transcriptional regulator